MNARELTITEVTHKKNVSEVRFAESSVILPIEHAKLSQHDLDPKEIFPGRIFLIESKEGTDDADLWGQDTNSFHHIGVE